jgi:murein DD-endopeptidase MepM/ murein hydrolase activator NlpD
VIGDVGRTGGIVDPHLHLQVTRDGRDVDPHAVIAAFETTSVLIAPGGHAAGSHIAQPAGTDQTRSPAGQASGHAARLRTAFTHALRSSP